MVLLLKLRYSPDESPPSGTVMAALIDIGLKQCTLENQKEVPKKKVVRKKVIRKVKKQECSVTSAPLIEKGLGDV
jgi:hypothetical protein